MSKQKRIITLLTDFGVGDWFVGTMKGVILSLQAGATIVDITHDIAPGDILSGAFALAAASRFFPRTTIHVAVVDPGVGSSRVPIVVQTKDHLFIGPDNGLLSLALARERIEAIHQIENRRFLPETISHTFHGRDIFAPAAAHLSKGTPCDQMGRVRKDFQKLPWREARASQGHIEGQIVYIDRFGNAISNIRNSLLAEKAGAWKVTLPGKRLCPVLRFYQSVGTGKPVAVPGSAGFLEVAINAGNAARQLHLEVGSKIIAAPASSSLSSSRFGPVPQKMRRQAR